MRRGPTQAAMDAESAALERAWLNERNVQNFVPTAEMVDSGDWRPESPYRVDAARAVLLAASVLTAAELERAQLPARLRKALESWTFLVGCGR